MAAAAGVSVATVSYVMNGRTDRRIPETTRERVLEAARTIGYAPNRAARNLRRRSTEQVCLVIGSFGVPAYDRLARSLQNAGDRVGYGLVTMVVDSPAAATKAVERLKERLADGALIAADIPDLQQEPLVSLAKQGLPLVMMSNTAKPDGFDVFRTPETAACNEAMAELLASGRRRIAFVGHQREIDTYRETGSTVSERLGAYLTALDAQGVEIDSDLVVPGADDRVSAYETVTELLNSATPPDGVFAASARAAVSAIWAARDLSVAVPDDLAIVGSGNLPEVRITRPSLSTVGPPLTEDFSGAARLLFDRVLGGRPTTGREISVPWTFIRRGST